jgi:hypothetical protein
VPNNRQRGKYGERSARDAIKHYWLMDGAHRTGQTSAKVSGADLAGTGDLHVEVKLRKTLSVEKFLEQAIRDARPGKVPVVVMRRDKGEWLVMLRISDSLKFAAELLLPDKEVGSERQNRTNSY